MRFSVRAEHFSTLVAVLEQRPFMKRRPCRELFITRLCGRVWDQGIRTLFKYVFPWQVCPEVSV
jgi:hypothetical protein